MIVFGADHIYRMDPRQMVDQHIASGAGVTVAALRAPLDQADQFGVIETAADGRRIARVPREADRRGRAPRRARPGLRVDGQLRVQRTTLLRKVVAEDAQDETSQHDVGGNLIPMLVERGEAEVYDFSDERGAGGDASATAATGATSGRSTRSGRPTWTSSRSTRCSTSTTWSGRS